MSKRMTNKMEDRANPKMINSLFNKIHKPSIKFNHNITEQDIVMDLVVNLHYAVKKYHVIILSEVSMVHPKTSKTHRIDLAVFNAKTKECICGIEVKKKNKDGKKVHSLRALERQADVYGEFDTKVFYCFGKDGVQNCVRKIKESVIANKNKLHNT